MEKICSKCKIKKPVRDFYEHKRDVYRSRCKPCHLGDNKEYRSTGYYREYLSSPDIAAKYFARRYLSHAVRDRRISKEPCAFCGAEQVQGHHPDYNQPLLIVWLCITCHRKLHVEIR